MTLLGHSIPELSGLGSAYTRYQLTESNLSGSLSTIECMGHIQCTVLSFSTGAMLKNSNTKMSNQHMD